MDTHGATWADFNSGIWCSYCAHHFSDLKSDGMEDLVEITGARFGTLEIPNLLYINNGTCMIVST
jgi:hypothetical protein